MFVFRNLFISLLVICICAFDAYASSEPVVEETPKKSYDDIKEITPELVDAYISDLIDLLNSGSGYEFSKFAEEYVTKDTNLDFSGVRKVPYTGREDFYIMISRELYEATSVLIGFFQGDITISDLIILNEGEEAEGKLTAIDYWETHNHRQAKPSTYALCDFSLKIVSDTLKLSTMSCELYAATYLNKAELLPLQEHAKRLKQYETEKHEEGHEEEHETSEH